MTGTKWKQEFFAKVEPIALRDPLAAILGAVDDGTPIYYTYEDCVKLAGHACASVSSAFMMTKIALKELYGSELPVRGEIEVRFAGGREDGANGPIGQVMQYITGAAIETGFHGLGGRFVRSNKFVYDENLSNDSGRGLMALFARTDTGEKIAVYADPSQVPMTDEDMENSTYMPATIQNEATPEEREKFFAYWQGKNKKILLDENPGVFTVKRV